MFQGVNLAGGCLWFFGPELLSHVAAQHQHFAVGQADGVDGRA